MTLTKLLLFSVPRFIRGSIRAEANTVLPPSLPHPHLWERRQHLTAGAAWGERQGFLFSLRESQGLTHTRSSPPNLHPSSEMTRESSCVLEEVQRAPVLRDKAPARCQLSQQQPALARPFCLPQANYQCPGSSSWQLQPPHLAQWVSPLISPSLSLHFHPFFPPISSHLIGIRPELLRSQHWFTHK